MLSFVIKLFIATKSYFQYIISFFIKFIFSVDPSITNPDQLLLKSKNLVLASVYVSTPNSINILFGIIHKNDISFNNFLDTEYKNNPKLLNDLIIKFKSSQTITDDPMYHVFLSFLFFINFIENYEGPFDSNSIRENYNYNYKS